MKTADLLNSIFIIIVFIALYVANILAIGKKNIENNWALYRCSPLVMPFANLFGHDTMENFAYCIQNMQSDFMGYLLQPLTFVTSSISSTLGNFTNDINMVRAMFDKVRTFMSSTIQSVFGVFLNLIIEFQRITIGIKDLIVQGETGYLAPEGDFKELANAVIKLLENPQMLSSFSFDSKNRAKLNFNFVNGIKDYEEFYSAQCLRPA